MKRSARVFITTVLVAALSACGGGNGGDAGGGGSARGDGGGNGQSDQGDRSAATCEAPSDLARRSDVPVGVLMPAGSLQRQSYVSGAEIAAAGLNAVSLGFEFYYSATGELAYDFDGNADDDAKERWKNNLRCNVIEAKQAGLVVAVWGQFIEAGRRGEPSTMPENVKNDVLESAVGLMPEVAKLLEELQVEYWSPVSELDKFAGPTGHNAYFARMVEAGRPHFSGTMYAQPNILQRDGFAAQQLEPDLGGVDALGISWISYECEEGKLPPGVTLGWADFVVQAAAAQGITRVFISEVGSTQAADESKRPCLETLIEYWDGATNGVFVLDMPSDQPGGAVVKGNWQEDVLRSLRN